VWEQGEDRWSRKLEDDGGFTVKSLYNKFEGVWGGGSSPRRGKKGVLPNLEI